MEKQNEKIENDMEEDCKMNVKNFFEKRMVKFFGVAFVFLLLGLSMIMAGTVVVKDGELIVSQDLNVDQKVLYVDSITNRVGIGVAIPTVKLDVAGIIEATDICTTDGNCLSTAGVGSEDITSVIETGATPLTFSPGCDNGDCSIGMDPITAADLATDSVGSDEIVDGSVGNAELIDDPIFTDVTVGAAVGSGRLKIPVYSSLTPPANPQVGEIWIET